MIEAIVMLCALIAVACLAVTAIGLIFGGRDEW